MSRDNTFHEAEIDRLGTEIPEGDAQQVMSEARRAAANTDADHGTINPNDRRFTLVENPHEGSLALRQRTATNPRQYSLIPRSRSPQTLVTSTAPRQRTFGQPVTQAGPNDPLVVTDAGQVVGHLRLTVTADEFQQLVTPNEANPTQPLLRIVTGGQASGSRPSHAPHLQPATSSSTTAQPNQPGTMSTLRATSTPASRSKKRAQKRDEEKDWDKAVEKPRGGTKAETDSCLTCIKNNRKCKGTELVWIHGEYRCKNCAEVRVNTGSRHCYWKDAAKQVYTYEEAQAAANRKPLFANTAAGVAARQARKALQAVLSQTDPEVEVEDDDETDNEEQPSEKDDSEVDLESAVEAAWQSLYSSITSGGELKEEIDQLVALQGMQLLWRDVVEEDDGRPVHERRWSPEVVSAVEARLNDEISRAQIAVDRAIDMDSSAAQNPL